MKKSDVVNLIKYHFEKENELFYKQSFEIAKEFYQSGDEVLAQYIENLMSKKYNLSPQLSDEGSFFEELNTKMKYHLYLPDQLSQEIDGVINSIQNNKGINKFLFSGRPGTGKTESAKYVANAVNRKLLSINFTNLIDSRLGETPKNIERMFAAINNIYEVNKYIFLFDEIDVIALDRINKNDLREMGRATSVFIKCLDALSQEAVVFATTNLEENLDNAIKRRFDYILNFDCYSKDILGDISMAIVRELRTSGNDIGELKLISKLVRQSPLNLSPAELRNVIRIALAFSDPNDEDSFFRRIFLKLYSNEYSNDLVYLKDNLGLTVREMGKVTGIPKSNISRALNKGEERASNE